MKNILVTSKELMDRNWDNIKQLLDANEINPIFNDSNAAMTAQEIIAVCGREKIEGIIVFSSSDQINEEVFANCKDLKVVSRHGVGVENIDLAAAKKFGVAVKTTIDLTDNETVADLTFGLMLSLARNIPQVDADLKKKKWVRAIGVDVWGKTLGIVGLGRIGQAVARRGLGFGMKVLAYDPYLSQAESGVEVCSYNKLLAESDFISLHLPLSDASEKMVGEKEFALMRNTAYLINTARAGLVDQQALINALKDCQIAGAGIDVFVKEPALNDPLINEVPEKLVVTSHIGVYTIEHLMNMDYAVVNNAVKVLAGLDINK